MPFEDRFETTLAVALLQSMLTICQELIRRSSNRKGKPKERPGLSAMANRSIFDEPALLGLDEDCIVQSWPSDRGLTYREIIECLRNALSHPCPQSQSKYPVTGYTTVTSRSGCIETFEFVQSSWINNKGTDLADRFNPRDKTDRARIQLENYAISWAKNASVEHLVVKRNEAGYWRVYR